jgi:GT2 family glycosyltransferase
MELQSLSKSPAVSVIVLNWNGKRYLGRCLDAIAAQTFQDYEVLVLDNASTDGSVEPVPIRWPSFHLVKFDQNLGFAVGNNQGAKLARGGWVAFLNNDAFPEPEWLAHLVRATQAHGEFTFFSSRLVYAEDTSLTQDTGDVYHVSGFAWPRDNNCPVQSAHLQCDEVFSPCAAAALYDREAFLEVGGFDEQFASHFEDVDLGFRLRLRGYRCLYIPEAVVAHVGSASYGRESNRTVYQVQRNVVWSYFANMPGCLFWKYLPAHLFANLVFLIYYSLRGQWGAIWKAKWHAVRSLPALLQKRNSIQSSRRVKTGQIERVLDHSWFGPFILGRRVQNMRLFFNRLKKGKS